MNFLKDAENTLASVEEAGHSVEEAGHSVKEALGHMGGKRHKKHTRSKKSSHGDVKTTGSRAEVFHGTAKHTRGGLKKADLFKNKYGRIVSKKASKSAKKNFSKNLPKKLRATPFKKGHTGKKRRTTRRRSKSRRQTRRR